ncbi:TPA: FMN reductase, partial [Escherichia coli]
ILFCAIEAIHRHATPYGLVWFDRSYHALMRPAC